MAQEERNRFVEWVELLRNQIPVLRHRFHEWYQAVREQPILLWETNAVRYSVYGLGAIVLLWSASMAAGMLAPPPPANARPAAVTADFHVVCSLAQCRHHFVIHRKFGFHGFPVVCPKCKGKTGMPARRCNSKSCLGRWVAPQRVDGQLYCPRCGHRFHSE